MYLCVYVCYLQMNISMRQWSIRQLESSLQFRSSEHARASFHAFNAVTRVISDPSLISALLEHVVAEIGVTSSGEDSTPSARYQSDLTHPTSRMTSTSSSSSSSGPRSSTSSHPTSPAAARVLFDISTAHSRLLMCSPCEKDPFVLMKKSKLPPASPAASPRSPNSSATIGNVPNATDLKSATQVKETIINGIAFGSRGAVTLTKGLWIFLSAYGPAVLSEALAFNDSSWIYQLHSIATATATALSNSSAKGVAKSFTSSGSLFVDTSPSGSSFALNGGAPKRRLLGLQSGGSSKAAAVAPVASALLESCADSIGMTPESFSSGLSSVFFVFCSALTHQLSATTDDEFYSESSYKFVVENARVLVGLLKDWLYRLYYAQAVSPDGIDASTISTGVMLQSGRHKVEQAQLSRDWSMLFLGRWQHQSVATKLFNALFARSERRPYLSPELWQVGPYM